MADDRLAGFSAVITGGSDGIGLGIATAFAAAGADLWLISRDQSKLDRAAESLKSSGVKVQTSAADLTDSAAIDEVADEIRQQWSGVNVLVNNAGMARFTAFAEVATEQLLQQVQLNMLAPYLLTQRLLPGLTATQGSVINISSTSAHRLIPGRPASVYAMTKGAINSLTKALALELGPQGVRVNAIAPGTINTPLTQNMIASFTPERKLEYDKFVRQSFALGRLGDPQDVAQLAVHLASPAANWITGSVFIVDGGLSTN